MKRRLFQGLALVAVFCLLLLTPEATRCQQRITCKDGDEFRIDNRGVIESAIPLVQNEKIVIDTASFRLTFYRDDQAVKSYPVAIGAPKTPSPIGEWKIIHKGGSWGGGFWLPVAWDQCSLGNLRNPRDQ